MPFHGCIFLAGANVLLHAPAAPIRQPSQNAAISLATEYGIFRSWMSQRKPWHSGGDPTIKSVALLSLALHFLDSAERRFISTRGSAATLRMNTCPRAATARSLLIAWSCSNLGPTTILGASRKTILPAITALPHPRFCGTGHPRGCPRICTLARLRALVSGARGQTSTAC